MSCQKCVAKVTAALQAVEGVVAVDVSLQDQQGRVTVAEPGPGRDRLLEAVVKAGFQTAAPAAGTRPVIAQDTAEPRRTVSWPQPPGRASLPCRG